MFGGEQSRQHIRPDLGKRPDGFMLSELEAKEQLLTLASISGTCPTEGKETATYKFLAEGLGNNSEKWILET